MISRNIRQIRQISQILLFSWSFGKKLNKYNSKFICSYEACPEGYCKNDGTCEQNGQTTTCHCPDRFQGKNYSMLENNTPRFAIGHWGPSNASNELLMIFRYGTINWVKLSLVVTARRRIKMILEVITCYYAYQRSCQILLNVQQSSLYSQHLIATHFNDNSAISLFAYSAWLSQKPQSPAFHRSRLQQLCGWFSSSRLRHLHPR